ncbi:MAG: class I SAM-dependent methyltransferase [Pseudomonadota bacterium]
MERQVQQLAQATTTLYLNPPADGFWQHLPAGSAVVLNAADAAAMDGHLEVIRGLPAELPSFLQGVLYLPKSKARLELMLAFARHHLQPDGQLWVVGAKKAGIQSVPRQLKAFADRVVKRDAARHCVVFAADQWQPADKAFDLAAFETRFQVGDHTLVSLPGVFSHGELDEGSALLLEHLPSALSGPTLDFGCGCGVLSLAAAQRGAQVTAIDVDLLAVASCERSAAENSLPVTVQAADRVPPGPWDAIISNPPFHQGISQDLSAAYQLIEDAAQQLSPAGQLWLVVNRHLDYPRRLAQHFRRVDEVAGSNRFRVLRAAKKH